MQGFPKTKTPGWKKIYIYAVMHLKLHGKHLSYALVQDTQKGGATSSHHPRLTCIPPSSLGQSAARLPRFTMSKWLLSSFIPLHGFCRCF